MGSRLDRGISLLWFSTGTGGAAFVVFMVIRGSDPIPSDALAIGGGVWFTVLSFWAGHVSRRFGRFDTRLNERLDRLEDGQNRRFDELGQRIGRLEKRLSERLGELKADLEAHIDIGHPK